jgi:hypothetical protein
MISMFQNAAVLNQNVINWIVTKVSPNLPLNFSIDSALVTIYKPMPKF